MISHKAVQLKNRDTIIYSTALAALLFLLKWLEIRFTVVDRSVEIYGGCIALIFTVLGVWFGLKLFRKDASVIKAEIKPALVEKDEPVIAQGNAHCRPEGFVRDQLLVSELALGKRALEVLSLLAEGYSNREIAEKLFISVSTVKTHNQNLFEKLGVKRRTQAVDKARRLRIIP